MGRSAKACVDSGLALLNRGRPAEAERAFREALAIDPASPEAHHDLALALLAQDRPQEAVAEGLLAVAARQEYPEAWCNLGNALLAVRKVGQAVVAYRESLKYGEAPETWNNLGLALQDAGLIHEALDAFRRAPGFASAHHNLGTLLKDLGRADEALAEFRRAVAADPDLLIARAALAHLRRHACDWDGLETDEAHVVQAVRQGGRIAPMILLGIASHPADQLACARAWVRPVEAAAAGHAYSAWPRLAQASGRLRLGYLSADFHAHATAYLTAELFERHDRTRFEVFGYSLGPDDGSDIRRRIIAGFDRFADLRTADHAAAARLIHDDGIDVLIDLKGHTQNARPEILALRPAPVQAAWLGYPGTMGADFIDWTIADAVVVPPEDLPFWHEKIAYLPDSYQSNDTSRAIAATPTRAACGLPETGFVFCAFNGAFKLSPAFFDIWMRLLKARPGSVLWLLEAPAPMPENLRRQAAARGVDPARLVFAPKLPLERHLARHRLADLFLDVLPYGAHTTASDALWTGLPVLTVRGPAFSGRVGASLLNAVGMPELIAESVDAYEAMALELSGDAERLAAVRRRLAERLAGAPLFDCARFTRAMEAACLRMWELRRAGTIEE
jgi:predicted O-linked N-acetylglucosamine transferase (SPINDLY family)